MARILVLEDNSYFSDMIEIALETGNHVVEVVPTGQECLERLQNFRYDLAIIDWNVPGLQGIDVCRIYRDQGGKTPMLFLTGKSDVGSKVTALDLGADDYLCKPFSYDELTARVRVLLRRVETETETIYKSGDMTLSVEKGTVTIAGATIELSSGEFHLLELLMSNPGHVFSPDMILQRVFTDETVASDAVKQRVMCLRKKLTASGHADSIVTIRQQGYVFEPRKNESG